MPAVHGTRTDRPSAGPRLRRPLGRLVTRHHADRACHRTVPLPKVELGVRTADPGGPRRPTPAHAQHQRQHLHHRVHQLCEPLPHEGRDGAAQVHQAAGAALHPQERGGGDGHSGLRHRGARQNAGE